MSDISANTNISAMAARRYMEKNSRMTSLATQELASGSVIFDPSRKPSEAAVGARLDAKISNLAQATKNASQLVALIQMGTGTLDTINSVLTRMQSLTSQGNNDALDDSMRAMLDQEYQQLNTQISNLAQTSRWNNTQLFNGSAASVANVGAITQEFTVNAVTNAFTDTFNTANSQGAIDGNVSSATVTANGGMYNVNVTFADGKVFAATVGAPTASGVLVLQNTQDSSSTLALNYAALVTAFDDTAPTFQTNLRAQLGVGTGALSFGTSSSIAMYTGATVTAGSSAVAGTYSMTYKVASGIGTFTVSDGQKTQTGTVTAAASISQYVNVGDFTLALSAFNGSANAAQTQFTVTGASTLSMGAQVEATAQDVLSITFRAATSAALGLSNTNVLTKGNAASTNSLLQSASSSIQNMIAELGGKRSQLDFQIDNLKISQQNQASAKSTYTDSNIAEATDRLVKYKALSSMSSSVFSQAIQQTSELARLVDKIQ